MFFIIFQLVWCVVILASLWRVFEKAGRPGWFAIIPFFNLYIMTRVGGLSGWWFVGSLIPFFGIIAHCYIVYKVGGNFGKGMLFVIGLILLPFIFYPILACSDVNFIGPVRTGGM